MGRTFSTLPNTKLHTQLCSTDVYLHALQHLVLHMFARLVQVFKVMANVCCMHVIIQHVPLRPCLCKLSLSD